MPVKYQTATYLVDKQGSEDLAIKDEGKLKVEARITSTRGPQPLWDIMKRLAAIKGMNVSWASDVDKDVLVDVNINASDDFFQAIDNLLRQVDYYHEMQGSTIIVKYKETRQFHIAMPFVKQTFKTKTGGDVLGGGSGGGGKGGGDKNANVAGEISLSSDGVAISNLRDGSPGGVEFNTWSSIENNLNAILNIWSTDSVESNASKKAGQESLNKQVAQETKKYDSKLKSASEKDTTLSEQLVSATFRKSTVGNTYFIDKPVGLITVTAPRPLLDKLEVYFKSLQKELYKQVVIEAKILEVHLDDSSSIGLDWNMLLKNLSVSAGSLTGGKTYSNTKTDTTNSSKTLTNTNTDTNTNTTTNTTGTTGDKTFDYTAADPLLTNTGGSTFVGSNVAENIISNVAGAAASSGVSAATILSQGVTGALSGAVSVAAFSFDSFLNAVSAARPSDHTFQSEAECHERTAGAYHRWSQCYLYKFHYLRCKRCRRYNLFRRNCTGTLWSWSGINCKYPR